MAAEMKNPDNIGKMDIRGFLWSLIIRVDYGTVIRFSKFKMTNSR